MPSPNEKTLHVLTGPTAVGKTALSLEWAEANGAEIVSCDSLLFYRGMDIGTAKPTQMEQARVRHHLIDVCDLDEQMDVTRYVAAARLVLEDLHAHGRRVLVVGGSGFYLRTFFSPVADDVPVPAELRSELESRLAAEGLRSLVAELCQRDPAAVDAIDLHNPRRVIRALERCRVTGRTLAELAAEFSLKPPPFADWSVRLVRLDRNMEELEARAAARVGQMLRDGLVAEVTHLAEKGLRRNASASRAIGYRETLDVLDGALRPDELAGAIIRNTRALMKKQRTWFRTQLPAHPVVRPEEARVDTLFG